MKLYWVKTRWFIKRIFSGYVWDRPNNGNKIYLTFDDGPTPEVTEWVLAVLQEHDIKATFFCIGNNIEKHPEIFNKVVAGGHAIGNHTFNHLNGWKTENDAYLKNIKDTEQIINNTTAGAVGTKLFRPPYGKIKKSQAAVVKREGYSIIMWDVLSADFDTLITSERCLNNVVENTRSGSIIIFHDSVKAYKNLEYALPKAIQQLKAKGFYFDKLA
ncbi:polysaccharide deacetylase family protein [Flavobacterium sp. MK4S-17]|uniref:polysaccharide deacetylase family protein n=1 Tax=Flavobacterium sp. MK4S-17 TaxID=2543737 RepID=UPI00135CC20B|nr:polysaccharide deacetylase family protein [Flavobacterium sp. MK4S-17]